MSPAALLRPCGIPMPEGCFFRHQSRIYCLARPEFVLQAVGFDQWNLMRHAPPAVKFDLYAGERILCSNMLQSMFAKPEVPQAVPRVLNAPCESVGFISLSHA